MKVKGLLVKAGEPTRNGRVFTKEAIKAMFESGGPKVVKKRLVGTFVDPAYQRPDRLDLNDIAVLVTDLCREKDGTELYAEVETLGTVKGLDAVHANELIEEARKEGKELGVLVLKPRGRSTVAEDGTIGDDCELEGIDLCWEQFPVGMSSKVNPELLKEPPETKDDE